MSAAVPESAGAIVEDILADYAEIAGFEESISATRFRIEQRALDLSRVPDRHERLRAAHTLYWQTEAPSWAIASGLLFDDLSIAENLEKARELTKNGRRLQSLMRRMIGSGYSTPCDTQGCDGRHMLHSRSGLRDFKAKVRSPGSYAQYRRFLCPECVERRSASNEVAAIASMERRKIERALYLKRCADDEAELCGLKLLSSLSEEQLVRLYELMSRIEGRIWGE